MTPQEFLAELQKISRLPGTYQVVEEFARARREAILRLVSHLSDDELQAVLRSFVPPEVLSKFMLRTTTECLHRELEGRCSPSPEAEPPPTTCWERLLQDDE